MRALYPNQTVPQKAWRRAHQKRLLDKGKIEKRVGALRSIPSRNPEVREKLRIEADYFERNAERMRYPNSHLDPLRWGCQAAPISAHRRWLSTLGTLRPASVDLHVELFFRCNAALNQSPTAA